jgi:hypothetical protein
VLVPRPEAARAWRNVLSGEQHPCADGSGPEGMMCLGAAGLLAIFPVGVWVQGAAGP